jgi:sigma-B regulation protein RsbU (phosphoserine phosphatase)
MAFTILSTLLVLIQLICVIIVVAYFLTRSRFFTELLDGHPVIRTQLILIGVFGALSIYGTINGVEIPGAIVNVRDLGPMVGGLVGGPVVGVGAGLIGAAFRWSLGGFTVIPCTIATILAGLFGGLIWYANNKKFVGITIAVLFAILMEGLHMLLTLAICRPFSEALLVVSTVALPMIIANATGVFVFAFIIRNLENERRMQSERDTLLGEMARKNAELQIAAEIQRNFLPETIPQTKGFDIAAKSIPAKEVGGDFFDVVPLEVIQMSNTKTGVMIADVSGKGVPAALFMALSRIVVRVTATWFKKPSEVISFANPIISNNSKTGMFVTLFYGIFDNETNTLTYVNAGHNPPIVFRKGSGKIEELELTGVAVGAMDDARFEQREINLSSGDVIVLYTDGITEALNEREEMFEVPRLIELIQKKSASSSQEIVDAIIETVFTFSGNQPQFDDITLMVVKVE